MKLRHPLPEKRLNPKNAVPKEILEQYPWHWDPMDKDHTDGNHFLKNIEFDWKGLGDWAIKKCNEHLTPQKYWRVDYEQDGMKMRYITPKRMLTTCRSRNRHSWRSRTTHITNTTVSISR